MSGFLTQRMLITRENADGEIQANPVCFEYLCESFDFKQSQASETNNLLGNGGDASPKSFGSSEFTGSVGHILSIGNTPMIMTHVLGAPLTTEDATTQTWAANTVFAKGDRANGVTNANYTLTCVKAGTSGATEPTLDADPNVGRGKKVVDGGVTWIAMPKLLKSTYELTMAMPTFTFEFELQNPAGEKFFKRYSGIKMGSMPMSLSGGMMALKMSIDFLGTSAIDSESDDWTTELEAFAGAKIVPAFQDFYQYEDSIVSVDDVPLCLTDNINLDLSRNITVKPAVNGCQRSVTGTASISGSMMRVFDKADYNSAKAHTDFKATFALKKANGCEVVITYPRVRPELAEPIQSIDDEVTMTVNLSAYGITGDKSVQATLIYPSYVDTTGALVGAY